MPEFDDMLRRLADRIAADTSRPVDEVAARLAELNATRDPSPSDYEEFADLLAPSAAALLGTSVDDLTARAGSRAALGEAIIPLVPALAGECGADEEQPTLITERNHG